MASSSFKAPCPLLWLLLATSGGFLPCLSSHAQIVINEIHYDPDVKTEPAEFVELYNAGSGPVDLSGWRFSSGVDYTFPPSTTLGPGEYLVVAQDPAFLQASFGGNALGPFSGRLSNDGETVRLDDASGQKRDEVDYQPGFPWPTVGDPPGYSIELVHPSLENDLGGSWRASHVEIATLPSQTLLPGGSTWRYFKGISEASTPSTEWRSPSFDDSTWLTGATPIGYEPVIPMQTYLSDMRSNYISVFLRNTFVVTNIAELNTVFLDALYDDGFKVWINGHPVLMRISHPVRCLSMPPRASHATVIFMKPMPCPPCRDT